MYCVTHAYCTHRIEPRQRDTIITGGGGGGRVTGPAEADTHLLYKLRAQI